MILNSNDPMYQKELFLNGKKGHKTKEEKYWGTNFVESILENFEFCGEAFEG